jgi:DNA polymerase-3 subunit gamma/tau
MDTLYLKYRPQKFEEIMWQDHVKKLFMNAIRIGKIAHSYLFIETRGTGKTSVA